MVAASMPNRKRTARACSRPRPPAIDTPAARPNHPCHLFGTRESCVTTKRLAALTVLLLVSCSASRDHTAGGIENLSDMGAAGEAPSCLDTFTTITTA
jgi:hypothetical protein